ncbi:MAG TPA: AbrB/MazE/SpoVT family DNA-binding domain-containing protein [Thermoanaerobaculia bacterium]|nr:AbrB/MazE/SpoVT family DNA-binding domain-containing protein [Thermoanaerobaculia bacterium]
MAKLGKAGRLVIPVALRRQLGIEEGDEVLLRLDEEGLHLSTSAQAVARAQAFVRDLGGLEGRDLAAELIAERRQETARESE